MYWSTAVAAAAAPCIVVMGDSLSAAYGLDVDQGWVSLLQQRLRAKGYPHRVHNASISGETTAGGLRRLPAVLSRTDPALVIIELGGNDGLRALSTDAMRRNLSDMVAASRDAGTRVLLLGMRIPSNYGPSYTRAFAEVFHQVAQDKGAALVDFFLAPIAQDLDYFQDDGIHPTADAQPLLLEQVWPAIEPLLETGPESRPADNPAQASGGA